MIKIRVLVFFLLIMILPNWIFAQEKKDKLNIQDQFIVSSLKTLAKTYFVCVNTDKVKAEAVANIEKMSNKKLAYHYSQFYGVIAEIKDVKKRDGFVSDMNKEDIIKNIKTLDKEKINKLIDDIPDAKILEVFKQYTAKSEGQSVSEKIQTIWSKIKIHLFGHE